MNAMNQDFAISEATALPDMRRRWWESKTRLNIRPVLWSLRNKPEEWEEDMIGSKPYYVVHKPSKHRFWVASGLWFYGLRDANCSCRQVAGGEFSFSQKVQFGRAYKHWQRQHGSNLAGAVEKINEQFAKHFLP